MRMEQPLDRGRVSGVRWGLNDSNAIQREGFRSKRLSCSERSLEGSGVRYDERCLRLS